MAKNKKKAKKKDGASMDVTMENNAGGTPQAMDTSEGNTRNTSLAISGRTIKKSIPIRRAKNNRKLKAQERAISNLEKSDVKISKNTVKKQRIQSAKTLYD
ncbi:hypothetical protein ZOSMA_50G00650 [Zostera marina]|uniref:Uncharacterized protein n=1 Tax=Zostera marina TaxID=29655 RepID=A0A0K9P0C5_ZOSMR|nr:hypothetical protein ZOSMA_50G00650 [Zostera marina]